MSDWQADQFQDELMRQQEIERIVLAAGTRPLTADEQRTIALEAGLGDITKERK
jgi:hypothetical protein